MAITRTYQTGFPPEAESASGGDRQAPESWLTQTRRIKALLLCLDLVAVVVAFLVALSIDGGEVTAKVLFRHGANGLVVLAIWALCLERSGLYHSRNVMSRSGEVHAILRAARQAVLFTVFFAFLFDLDRDVAKPTVLYALPLAIMLLFAEREGVRWHFARMRRRGRHLRTVILVGANEEGRALARMFEANPSFGYRSIGFVDDHIANGSGLPILGPIDSVVEIARSHAVSGVMISTSSLGPERCTRLSRELIGADLWVELSSSLHGVAPDRMVSRPMGSIAVVALDPARQLGWRAVAKRSFDICAAGGVLVVVSPIMLLVAIAIRIDSRGPLVFRQERVGRNGKRFTCLKFRSMVADAEDRLVDLREQNEADGPLFKIRADPRVTRVGRFIRRWSIDELPQLVNVVRGDMSTVGPRPALPHEVEHWDATLYHRLRVRPGLTGMWQVAGRHQVSFEEYARLDLYYVDNWSLVTDLSLVVRTIPVLLRG